MSNVLNAIISNRQINSQAGAVKPDLSVNTYDKVKPLEYKGKLLPSKIIGSPIEYVKDLKNDVVSIGKAAKGKANDHELGRINDIAMKLGSFGLAAYLFAKNPLKLSKAMEFAGFGTFFASMALWPKIAIQAPLRARTGVDIHQKYIDTQGRKKMLFQDPQYVLTDLYSREELDKMGEKLKVSKNIPDRDNFIKQRAQKVALQGNTLWMMTAGFASPIMSALACNTLEKPIGAAIENLDMITSEKALMSGKYQGFFGKIKQKFADWSFNRFLAKNADNPLTDGLVDELKKRITSLSANEQVADAISEELKLLRKNSMSVDMQFVRNALKDIIPESVFDTLSPERLEALNQGINKGSFEHIAKVLSGAVHSNSGKQQIKLNNDILKQLNTYNESHQPVLSQAASSIKKLYSNVADMAKGDGAIAKFINSRVGNKSGSFVAKQYERFQNGLMKTLKFSMKDLKAMADGDISIFTSRLEAISQNPEQYDKVVKKLSKLIDRYERVTGKPFMDTVRNKSKEIYSASSEALRKDGFNVLADKLSSAVESKSGTLQNFVVSNAEKNGLGARASFFRVLQCLDIFNKASNKTESGISLLRNEITQVLKNNGLNADELTLQKLEDACKRIILSGNANTHTEKLAELTESEYKTVMDVLFNSKSSTIKGSLNRTLGKEESKGILKHFDEYIDLFKTKVANWKNNMTVKLSRKTYQPDLANPSISNAIERNSIIGQETKDLVKDAAQKMYNSKKWLHIFGGAMAVLTAVTLAAGLLIGRKGETEKQVETESKKND